MDRLTGSGRADPPTHFVFILLINIVLDMIKNYTIKLK